MLQAKDYRSSPLSCRAPFSSRCTCFYHTSLLSAGVTNPALGKCEQTESSSRAHKRPALQCGGKLNKYILTVT
eukprot:3955607-Amphidinium_carterae.1